MIFCLTSLSLLELYFKMSTIFFKLSISQESMLMPGYELRANSLILLALIKHLEYGKRPLELIYI